MQNLSLDRKTKSLNFISSGVSDTKGDTSSVLGVVEDIAHVLPENEKLTHLMASANPVSSVVLLLLAVAPKSAGCRGSQIAGPQRIWTKLSGETVAIPSQSHQCRQDCA